MKYSSKLTLLATLSVCFTVANPAFAMGTAGESEPNQPIYSPQVVSIPADGVTISAVVGSLGSLDTNDLDFFTFYGHAGDVVTIDIDGGIGGEKNVDTYLGLFGPGPTYQLLTWNDDASIDTGSISSYDSRLTQILLPATGNYTVGVSSYPRAFVQGGQGIVTNDTSYQGPDANGDYDLVITGVTALSVKQVNIDVKPGNDNLTLLDPNNRGEFPVAILSAEGFNAMDVDTSTITFGSTGDENSMARCKKSGKDVNKDGRLDRVCHFRNYDANFQHGNTEGFLKANMSDGTAVEGHGVLKIKAKKIHVVKVKKDKKDKKNK